MNDINVTISIKGHLNEPIGGLMCTDFDFEGHNVIGCTEDPEGKYIIYYQKKMHPFKSRILNAVKHIKDLFR